MIAPELSSPSASSWKIRRRTGSPRTSNACMNGNSTRVDLCPSQARILAKQRACRPATCAVSFGWLNSPPRRRRSGRPGAGSIFRGGGKRSMYRSNRAVGVFVALVALVGVTGTVQGATPVNTTALQDAVVVGDRPGRSESVSTCAPCRRSRICLARTAPGRPGRRGSRTRSPTS